MNISKDSIKQLSFSVPDYDSLYDSIWREVVEAPAGEAASVSRRQKAGGVMICVRDCLEMERAYGLALKSLREGFSPSVTVGRAKLAAKADAIYPVEER